MTALDWTIIAVHLSGVVGLGLWVSRHQKNVEDYYVGGRNLPWWAVAISAMATQTSANSFIGIPAFVALAPGGGLSWLQYELGVPIAMIVVMVMLVPFFRRLQLISVYQYLELRFDRLTRKTVSALFLTSRGLAAGVQVYASGVVLSVCLGIPVWLCILVMGAATTLYDSIGGMTAVVYADVVQMVILLGGIILCIVMATLQVGSVSQIIHAHDPARLQAVQFVSGLSEDGQMPFWGFLLGGFVLYVSYYGVDQSQAQRVLSAPSVDESKRALLFNGLARFPLTLLYLVMGLCVGAVFANSPELQAAVPADRLDSLLPEYIRLYLPSGARGILFAAILAAAISSLDSNLNSLSASTMRDFVEPLFQRLSKRGKLWLSKGITAIWGLAITLFAFWVGNISSTVVEGINKLGSFFYGPILAAFLMGIVDKRSKEPAVLAGVAVGILCNVVLYLFLAELFWMWWNVIGLLIAMAVTFVMSRLMGGAASALHDPALNFTVKEAKEENRGWLRYYMALFVYFVAMVAFTIWIDDFLMLF